jgi:hypothetical protein
MVRVSSVNVLRNLSVDCGEVTSPGRVVIEAGKQSSCTAKNRIIGVFFIIKGLFLPFMACPLIRNPMSIAFGIPYKGNNAASDQSVN